MAAQDGDVDCQQIIDDVCKALGLALSSLVNVLNPDQIVVGGGVSQAGEALFTPLTKYIKHYSLDVLTKDLSVVPAQLGNDAGLIGAAGLVK